MPRYKQRILPAIRLLSWSMNSGSDTIQDVIIYFHLFVNHHHNVFSSYLCSCSASLLYNVWFDVNSSSIRCSRCRWLVILQTYLPFSNVSRLKYIFQDNQRWVPSCPEVPPVTETYTYTEVFTSFYYFSDMWLTVHSGGSWTNVYWNCPYYRNCSWTNVYVYWNCAWIRYHWDCAWTGYYWDVHNDWDCACDRDGDFAWNGTPSSCSFNKAIYQLFLNSYFFLDCDRDSYPTRIPTSSNHAISNRNNHTPSRSTFLNMLRSDPWCFHYLCSRFTYSRSALGGYPQLFDYLLCTNSGCFACLYSCCHTYLTIVCVGGSVFLMSSLWNFCSLL